MIWKYQNLPRERNYDMTPLIHINPHIASDIHVSVVYWIYIFIEVLIIDPDAKSEIIGSAENIFIDLFFHSD